ncbi:MAG TPA: hypothetical protein PKX92_04195 [Edaphocola sp.]|nr:hypothetical protein [Edaphocola sp.]
MKRNVRREDIDQNYYANTDSDKLFILQYQYHTKNEKEHKEQIQKVIDYFVPISTRKISE